MKKSALFGIIFGAVATVLVAAVIVTVLLIGRNKDTHDHIFGEWKITEKAGCLNDGERQRTCACGEVETENIPSLGHIGSSTVIPPTCVSNGYTKNHCNACNIDYISNMTSPLGHSYGEWAVLESADCTHSGIDTRLCQRCHDQDLRVAKASGHNYILVSEDSSNTYKCEHCPEYMITEKELSELTDEENYVSDCPSDFSFEIICYENEEYIRKNLVIYDAYFDGSNLLKTNSGAQPLSAVTRDNDPEEDIYVVYDLIDLGNGKWQVSPTESYEYSTTYKSSITGDIAYSDTYASEYYYKTESDPEHEDVLDYRDDIIYLQALDKAAKLTDPNAGYYPYTIESYTEEGLIYFTVHCVDGLEVGDIVCIGEAENENDIIASNAETIIIGKIHTIEIFDPERYLLVLEAPTLEEVFENLDVTYDDELNLEDIENLTEEVENAISSYIYEDEDFQKFLAATSLAAEEYLAQRNLSTTLLASKSFIDNLKITPSAKIQNNTIKANVTGTLNIPIKQGNKDLGKIEVNFEFYAESKFNIRFDYSLRYFWFIPYAVEYMDLCITQTDAFGFKFHLGIEIDYSLTDTSKEFVQNTDPKSLKIHCKDCEYVTRIKDQSKLKYLSLEEADKLIKNKGGTACELCKPIEGLDRSAFWITGTGHFHAYNCYHTESSTTKTLSRESADTLIKKGYDPCDYCQPQKLSVGDFEKKLMETLKSGDWKSKLEEIKSCLPSGKDATTIKSGKTIARGEIPIIPGISAAVVVDYVLDFKLEANADYQYEIQRVTQYGMRLQNSKIHTYKSEVSKKITKNELTLVGQAHLRTGLSVSLKVGVSGLTDFMNISMTVQAGIYSDVYGVVRLSTTDQYAAAYFEFGVYVDIDASYKLAWLTGSVDLYSQTFPIQRLGYDKAYFAYSEYVEYLDIKKDYDIKSSNLLKTKYFNLKNLSEVDGEKLDINGKSGLYSVSLKLESGKYATISNGVIKMKSNAPCYFTDKLIIEVKGTAKWNNYVKGSSVYYLDTYIIELHFYGREHSYSQSANVPATCTQDGYIEYTCSFCKDVQSDTIKSQGHVGGTATCTKQAVCDICSTPYGEIFDHTGGMATCESPAICENCYQPYGPTLSHTGGIATCTKQAECDVCKAPYGELGDHDFVDTVCTSCGISNASEGLAFRELDDGTYEIIAIDKCADKDLVIPKFYNQKDVTRIGDGAFDGLSITSVTFPSTLTEIGDGAFQNCLELRELIFSDNVTYIGNNAFADCTALVSVTFGESILEIGDFAFADCWYLESISIPDSVTSIGKHAFSYCSSLTSASIGSDVEFIGEAPFSYCWSLSSITVSSENDKYAVIDNCLIEIDTGTLIQGTAMSTIPNSVTKIGDYAFAGIYVMGINAPNSVTHVGNGAFEDCTDLLTVTLGANVEFIGKDAFKGCTWLEEVDVATSNWQYCTDPINGSYGNVVLDSATANANLFTTYHEYYFVRKN